MTETEDRAQWAVEVLDAWAEQKAMRSWRSSNDGNDRRVTLYQRGMQEREVPAWFAGPTHAAARIKAAEALQHEDPSLPAPPAQGREGKREWVLVADELPDSDELVLIADNFIHDSDDGYELARLEFTDDNEGHGEPYWLTRSGREMSPENYPLWAPLPAPPVPETKS